MKKKITIRIIVLAIIALATFLILQSSSVKRQPASEECCQKKCKAPDDNNMIWETFSRQLISASNWQAVQ